MIIEGSWYSADSSKAHKATIELNESSTFHLSVEGQRSQSQYHELDAIIISDRVGNIPRKLKFNDGSLFETSNNDAIDNYLAEYSTSKQTTAAAFFHKLESRIAWVISALIFTVLITAVSFIWGIPWVSHKIAMALPVSVTDTVSRQTFETFDKYMLEKSELPQAQQDKIRAHFENKILPVLDKGYQYKLHFRKFKDMPNAFALPSGDMVISDKLIEIAANQNEIDAVLFHEAAHVNHRHGLKHVVRSSIFTILITLMLGDISATGDLLVGLPVFLLQSDYSRKFETESDEYAFVKMMKAGIDPIAFATIMGKIEMEVSISKADFKKKRDDKADKELGESDANIKAQEIAKQQDQDVSNTSDSESGDKKAKKKTILDYISTHPMTSERIKNAEEYSERFKKGLTN